MSQALSRGHPEHPTTYSWEGLGGVAVTRHLSREEPISGEDPGLCVSLDPASSAKAVS